MTSDTKKDGHTVEPSNVEREGHTVEPSITGNAGAALKESAELNLLKEENEKLKNEIRMDRAHGEMTRRLTESGAWSPGLMFGAVAGELQFDDEGKLLNGAAIVEKLKREYPESFMSGARAGSIDGGAGATAGRTLTKEALSKMSPDEIRKLDWADVKQVLGTRD